MISSGGSSFETVVFLGGTEVVSSGGFAIATAVGSAGVLDIQSGGSVSGGPVDFLQSSGTLQLDDSQHFSGFIEDFDSGEAGSSSLTNFLDLRDILYSSHGVSIGWTPSVGFSGTLTVGDGQGHTANLTLIGNFSAGDFHATSDGFGGTVISDPSPNSAASGTTLTTHTG